MKKWFPVIMSVAATVVASVSDDAHAAILKFAAEHADVTIYLVGAFAVFKGLLPSPVEFQKIADEARAKEQA